MLHFSKLRTLLIAGIISAYSTSGFSATYEIPEPPQGLASGGGFGGGGTPVNPALTDDKASSTGAGLRKRAKKEPRNVSLSEGTEDEASKEANPHTSLTEKELEAEYSRLMGDQSELLSKLLSKETPLSTEGEGEGKEGEEGEQSIAPTPKEIKAISDSIKAFDTFTYKLNLVLQDISAPKDYVAVVEGLSRAWVLCIISHCDGKLATKKKELTDQFTKELLPHAVVKESVLRRSLDNLWNSCVSVVTTKEFLMKNHKDLAGAMDEIKGPIAAAVEATPLEDGQSFFRLVPSAYDGVADIIQFLMVPDMPDQADLLNASTLQQIELLGLASTSWSARALVAATTLGNCYGTPGGKPTPSDDESAYKAIRNHWSKDAPLTAKVSLSPSMRKKLLKAQAAGGSTQIRPAAAQKVAPKVKKTATPGTKSVKKPAASPKPSRKSKKDSSEKSE